MRPPPTYHPSPQAGGPACIPAESRCPGKTFRIRVTLRARPRLGPGGTPGRRCCPHGPTPSAGGRHGGESAPRDSGERRGARQDQLIRNCRPAISETGMSRVCKQEQTAGHQTNRPQQRGDPQGSAPGGLSRRVGGRWGALVLSAPAASIQPSNEAPSVWTQAKPTPHEDPPSPPLVAQRPSGSRTAGPKDPRHPPPRLWALAWASGL